MPDCSQLPKWISYSQALAVPLLAVVVAAFGVFISARQMSIADDKLKRDTFDKQYDRRVATYEATRKFLQSMFINEIIPESEIKTYGFHTLDAQFLFDEAMFKYLIPDPAE